MQQVKGLSDRGMLVGVVQRVDQYLGLTLLSRNVVADLGGVQLAPLVARADREHIHNVRVRSFNGEDLRLNLLIGFECSWPQVARSRRGGEPNQQGEDHSSGQSGATAGHRDHTLFNYVREPDELLATPSHAQIDTRRSGGARQHGEGECPR